MRKTLVTALVSCAGRRSKARARRFLLGLSADELEFIAEVFGAWILESSGGRGDSRAELAAAIAQFPRTRAGCRGLSAADHEHKMILVFEYLYASGLEESVALRSAPAQQVF